MHSTVKSEEWIRKVLLSLRGQTGICHSKEKEQGIVPALSPLPKNVHLLFQLLPGHNFLITPKSLLASKVHSTCSLIHSIQNSHVINVVGIILPTAPFMSLTDKMSLGNSLKLSLSSFVISEIGSNIRSSLQSLPLIIYTEQAPSLLESKAGITCERPHTLEEKLIMIS